MGRESRGFKFRISRACTKAGIPEPANPYEYQGDLALAYLKGTNASSKSSVYGENTTDTSGLNLPGGLGIQDVAWNNAMNGKGGNQPNIPAGYQQAMLILLSLHKENMARMHLYMEDRIIPEHHRVKVWCYAGIHLSGSVSNNGFYVVAGCSFTGAISQVKGGQGLPSSATPKDTGILGTIGTVTRNADNSAADFLGVKTSAAPATTDNNPFTEAVTPLGASKTVCGVTFNSKRLVGEFV